MFAVGPCPPLDTSKKYLTFIQMYDEGRGAKGVREGNKRYERIDKPGVSGEDTRDSSNGGNNSHKIFACLCYSRVWLYFHICFALSLSREVYYFFRLK